MASFDDVLKNLEGVLDPAVLANVENMLKEKAHSLEQEFVQAAEQKYGVSPAVVSDVEKTVEDVAPVAAKAAESVLPDAAQKAIADLLAQVNALTAQVNSLKTQGSANQTTSVMGQGEPVPHNLFLDDGTVVKNHPGLATHYAVTIPATATTDAQEVVKQVVAAYPA